MLFNEAKATGPSTLRQEDEVDNVNISNHDGSAVVATTSRMAGFVTVSNELTGENNQQALVAYVNEADNETDSEDDSAASEDEDDGEEKLPLATRLKNTTADLVE